MRHLLLAAALAVGLTACAPPVDGPSPTSSSPSPTASVDPTAFAVTSPDFSNGGELEDWATASAFGGQCNGDNLNPALEWSNVPDGTQAFAVTFIDRSASNFIHWVHFDIPGDSTGVERGGSATLEGNDGANSPEAPDAGYFGPCPPGPDHRYEFTVYALDAPLGLAQGAGFAEVKAAIDEHELAEASISGMRSGPAS